MSGGRKLNLRHVSLVAEAMAVAGPANVSRLVCSIAPDAPIEQLCDVVSDNADCAKVLKLLALLGITFVEDVSDVIKASALAGPSGDLAPKLFNPEG